MLYAEFDYGWIEVQDRGSSNTYDDLNFAVRTYPEVIEGRKYLTIIYRDGRGRKHKESFPCDMFKFVIRHQGDMVFNT